MIKGEPLEKVFRNDKERFDFQSRRYSNSMLIIGLVGESRILLCNALREPVMIVESLDQLRSLLIEETTSEKLRYANRAIRQRQRIEEEDELTTELAQLKIDI